MRRLIIVALLLCCSSCADDPNRPRVKGPIYIIDAHHRCLSIDTWIAVAGGEYSQSGTLNVHIESMEKCQ